MANLSLISRSFIARRHLSCTVGLFEANHYETLKISRDATTDQVKKAYRTMAKEHHPDSQGKGSADMFQKVSEAYNTLSDSQKRQAYDAKHQHPGSYGGSGAAPGAGAQYDARQQGFQGWNNMEFSYTGNQHNAGATANLHGMWEDIFGAGAATGGARERVSKYKPEKGQDVTVKLQLGFVESVEGCKKEISYFFQDRCRPCNGSGSKGGKPVQKCAVCGGRGKTQKSNGYYHMEQPCQACNGAGEIVHELCNGCGGKGTIKAKTTQQVNVPPGVDTKDRLRVAGKGECGIRGGTRGNLFLDIIVENDSVFTRDGEDIHVIQPITMAQAVLGGKISVATLTGDTLLTVPAATQEGDKLILRQRGIKKPQSAMKGDQFVHFHICIPKVLTEKQRLAMEHFQEDEKDSDVSALSARHNMLKLKAKFKRLIDLKDTI